MAVDITEQRLAECRRDLKMTEDLIAQHDVKDT